jgi:hypothetical protein
MAALMKLGGNLLAPAVKREQDAQFMQGMQRAAQEEAITEIVNEQPWYSKLFGSTSLVDGARVWKANALVTDLAANLEGQATEIAKMPGDAFARHLNNMLSDNLSGDGPTDMAVRQQFINQMPDIMRKQAKNHGLWQKQDAIESNRKSVAANLNRLVLADASARNPKKVNEDGSIPGSDTDDGDLLTVGIKAIEAMDTPVGMDPAVHKQMLAAEVVKSINGGSFAVFNMLEGGQMLDRFEPAQAGAIRSAVNALRSQVRAELPVEFASVINSAQRATDVAGNTPEVILAEVEKINKAYERITGDKKPYVSAQGASSLLQALHRTQQQELEEARRGLKSATTVAEKEAKAEVIVNDAVARLKGGAPVNDLKAEEIRAAWSRLELNDPVAANRARVLNYATQLDPERRDGMRNAINNAKMGGSEEHLFAAYTRYYAPLAAEGGDAGLTAAAAYAGDFAGMMQRYHTAMKNTKNPTQFDRDFAYQYAIQEEPRAPTKKEEDVAKYYTQGWAGNLYDAAAFWNDDVPVKNPKQVSAMVAPFVTQGVDTEKGIKAALANNKELYIAGGYHWKRGAGQTDLNAFYERAHKDRDRLTPADKQEAHTVDAGHRNRAFAMAVEETAKKFGLGEVTQIFQVGNANDGTPQFAITGATPLGDVVHAYMTARDVEQLWANRDKTKAKEVPMADPRNVGKSALEVANERFRKEQTK